MVIMPSSILIVVISLSKIKISKAIHNRADLSKTAGTVVISLSKIKISKAIHNSIEERTFTSELLSVYQR